MLSSNFLTRALPLAGAAALVFAAGAASANAPAPAAKAADVKATAATGTSTAQRAATPLKRNAQGQIESLETRNWAAIDKDRDNLISPAEMQAYLDANKR